MNGSLPSVTLMKGKEADIRLIVEGFECTDVQNMLSCSIRSYTFGKKVRGQDVGPIYVVSSFLA